MRKTPSFLGYALGYVCPSLDKASENSVRIDNKKKALQATLPEPFNVMRSGSRRGARPRVSRQVRRGTLARFRGRQAQLSWRLTAPRSTEDLFRLASAAVPERLLP